MTKYPIKHTMEFGEEPCSSYKGNSRHMLACGQCNRSGTIPISVTFDLIKDCPECGGKGHLPTDDTNWFYDCPHCSDNGLPAGKVHRYVTPEEWHVETGEVPADDADIWVKSRESETWIKTEYSVPEFFYHKDGRILLRFPLQPAPPADYRP